MLKFSMSYLSLVGTQNINKVSHLCNHFLHKTELSLFKTQILKIGIQISISPIT